MIRSVAVAHDLGLTYGTARDAAVRSLRIPAPDLPPPPVELANQLHLRPQVGNVNGPRLIANGPYAEDCWSSAPPTVTCRR